MIVLRHQTLAVLVVLVPDICQLQVPHHETARVLVVRALSALPQLEVSHALEEVIQLVPIVQDEVEVLLQVMSMTLHLLQDPTLHFAEGETLLGWLLGCHILLGLVLLGFGLGLGYSWSH